MHADEISAPDYSVLHGADVFESLRDGTDGAFHLRLHWPDRGECARARRGGALRGRGRLAGKARAS